MNKSKYSIKTVTSFVIDYSEFDRLINDHFPQFNGRYECVADNEWDNDSDHSTNISKEWSEKYDLKDFDRIDQGDVKYIGWGKLLAYLAYKDIVPFGNWVISVSW